MFYPIILAGWCLIHLWFFVGQMHWRPPIHRETHQQSLRLFTYHHHIYACACVYYIYIFINMEINLLIDILSTITHVDTHAHTHTIYIYIYHDVYIHIIYRISRRYRLPVITFGFHRSIGSRLLSLPEACPTSSATTRVSAAWRTTGATGASRYGALAKCRSKAWMGAMVGTYGVIIYF